MEVLWDHFGDAWNVMDAAMSLLIPTVTVLLCQPLHISHGSTTRSPTALAVLLT